MYLVIGNSIAAISAVEALRRVDPAGEITVVGREGRPPYSPVLTPNYIAGELPEEKLYFRPESFYRQHRVKAILNNGAVQLLTGKRVLLESGLVLEYEQLLIATGARPRPANFPGAEKQGVFVLRSFQDAVNIRSYARGKKSAVILGGGPISMRSAWALRKLNMKVSIIISSNRLLSRLVEEEIALVLEEHLLREGGYRVYKNCDLVEVMGKEKVEAVRLSSGEVFPADLIVVGKGVIANKELAAGTGIDVQTGILTDERMETTLPGVYAAGDVAQAYDALSKSYSMSAIWPAAFAQGKVAGANMGGAAKIFTGSVPMNVLEVGDVTLSVVGTRTGEAISSNTKTALKKIYLEGNKITGAVFLGSPQGIGTVKALIKKEVPVDKLPSPERLLGTLEYAHLREGVGEGGRR